MPSPVLFRRGVAKPLIVLVLVVLVAVSFYIMTQEQQARDHCQRINDELVTMLDGDPTTAADVHAQLGLEPTATRTPAKHKMVEEYRMAGPMNSYVVYAYYQTAATELLSAVSLNQQLPDWETE